MVGAASGGDGDPFERIVPIAVGRAGNVANVPQSRSARFAQWRAPAAFAALLVLLAAALFWLPHTVPDPAAAGIQPNARVAPQQVDKVESVVEPTADVEAALQKRQHAESAAAQLHALQEKLALMHASQWAAQQAASLAQQAAQADARFAARDFNAAIHSYEQAIHGAEQLLAHADEVLAAALVSAQSALQAGDTAAAADAFARAVSIDANNAEALAGQRRARNFDAVQALINRASAAESAGDSAAARAGFKQALELDAENQAARAGLARLQTAAANQAFAAQMSRGLSALDQGDYNTAQAAFQTALKLRAGAAAARDGLAQARSALQSARVQSLRETAQLAEQDEQWVAARAAYAAVLVIDSSLAFAQHGQQRADRRAVLAAQLQAHIDHAERLSASSVRADAGAALAEAAAVAAPGPRLQAQRQQLSGLIEAATTPVAVTLRSDGKTRVIVYPIGEVGQFESRSLSLTPGQYTAVGRRPGYREVRVTFNVTREGIASAPIIQCEEPI